MNIASPLNVEYRGPLLGWLPDETLFSLCSRQHVVMGSLAPSATSQAIFGLPEQRISHDIPCGLEALERSEFHQWGTSESVLHNHTIFPIFVPFQNRTKIEQAIATIRGGYIGSLKYALGLVSGGFGAEHPLKACRDCMREDVNTHGVAYWHLTHQYPGVEICPYHSTWLAISTNSRPWSGRFEWSLPNDADLISQDSLQQLWSRPAFLFLASSVIDLAALGRLQTLEPYAVASTYRSAMVGVGLTDGFLPYMATLRRFHLFASLPTDKQSVSSFLAQLTRTPRRSLHPLKHLILINWLFEGLQSFLDAYQAELAASGGELPLAPALQTAEQCPPPTTPTPVKGPPRPKRVKGHIRQELLARLVEGCPKKELCEEFGIAVSTVNKLLRTNAATYSQSVEARHKRERDEHRGEWLRLHNLHPDLGIKALRKQSGALYAWLYRNDKAWLMAQGERCPKPTRVHRKYVDWEARDYRLLGMLREACRIIALQQVPVRKRDLYAMVPTLWSCLQKRDRYPKSRAYLSTALVPNAGRPVGWQSTDAAELLGDAKGERMNTISILEPALLSPLACWSYSHRCYELRREQILRQATYTLGNRLHAERWLISPALALNRHRPCCLLAAPLEFKEVRAVLYRIEHGVYM